MNESLSLASGQSGVTAGRSAFQSAGKRIGVETFLPHAATAAPALVVLHGAGGMDGGNKYVRQLAAGVAGRGYATFLIEYFHRTGITYASEAVIYAQFTEWLEAINDGVGFVSAHPAVDPKRLGFIGFSLGGYLAVAHAASDRRVRAVVEIAGGVDPQFARSVKRLPPILIIHGRDDQRVALENAVRLEQLARTIGSPVTTEYFEGERHVLSPVAAIRALARALAFCDEHLR